MRPNKTIGQHIDRLDTDNRHYIGIGVSTLRIWFAAPACACTIREQSHEDKGKKEFHVSTIEVIICGVWPYNPKNQWVVHSRKIAFQ